VARVAAAHRDDDIGRFDRLGGEDFGLAAAMSIPTSAMVVDAPD
jgi:hypothetical protein